MSGRVKRSTITATLTRPKAKSVPMLVASASWASGIAAARTPQNSETITVLATGTPLRLTFAKDLGTSPSRDIAKRMRVWPYSTVSTTLAMAMTAPAARSTAQKLWPVTPFMMPASAASESLNSPHGSAPTAIAATSTYSAVTISSDSMIALGRSFFGFLASSPAVEAASKPMYEKNSVAPAALTPPRPSGMKGA